MAGVTPDGRFEILRLEELLQLIDDDLRAGIDGEDGLGDDVRLDGDSVLGQVRAAPAVQLASVWEAIGELATALDPDQAQGALLDGLVRLSGVAPRLPPIPSTGAVTLTGATGTLVPAGARIRGATSGVLVETVAPVQIPGSGSITVGVRALDVGPLDVPAGDLTSIVTPYAGWVSVTNASALTAGRLRESDSDLRLRRELSLQATGRGTDGGIRAAMLAIPQVQQALVISNRTNSIRASGQAPKSVRVVLWPDTAAPAVELTIAEALEAQLRAGIQIWGQDASVTLLDDQDRPQTYAWDYATEVGVYVSVALTVTARAPASVGEQVARAISDYLTTPALRMGQDVTQLRIRAVIAAVSPEIESATVLLGISDPPLSTGDIAIAEDAIARRAAGDSVTATVTVVP